MAEHDHERQNDNQRSRHERRTDSDLVGRIGQVVERYKILYAMMAAIFVWWTRTIVVPLRESAQTTGEVKLINKKIDEVLIPRLETADQDRRRLIAIQENQSSILGVLTRMQCLRTNAIDRAKIDLECKDIPFEVPPVMMWDGKTKR